MEQRRCPEVHQINYLSSEMESLYHQASLRLGISDSASIVLYTIYDAGEDCLLRDIYQKSGISKQTVNSAIRALEADEILRLERHTGRSKKVILGARGEILENCIVYGRILLCALPFLVLQFMTQSFFVAAEKPRLGLAVTVAAGVTNMVMDVVLVMLLPKEYKLAGAAIATGLSQLVGGVVPLVYFFRPNSSLLRLGRTRFDGRALVRACANGSSEFMSNVSMNVVGMLYNLQLLKYAGDDGVAAYGVMMYVSMIFSAAFLGYSIGSAPVVSYHYGAGNRAELRGILKQSLVIIGAGGAVMLTAAQLLAAPLSGIFVGYSEELLNMTVHGLRIFALSFPFMGFAIFGSGFFTALNDGLTSALISFLRTLVFQIGTVLLLPVIWGIDGIWFSVMVAEMMAVLFTVIFLITKRRW